MMRGLGQALEGIKAIGSLAAGAVVLWLVYAISDPLLAESRSRAPGGYGGLTGADWLSTGLDSILPAAFLLLVFFGLVATAALSREVAR